MQFRRPSSAAARPRFFATIAGRRLLRQAGIVLGAFLLGYAIAAFWIFPAPLFSSEHAVPRVLDLGATEARQKLESQGFRLRLEDQQTDPTVPKGAVIWQDPPPGVVLTPNAQVAVVVSEGAPDVPVPDVAGLPRPLAEKVLRAAGFGVAKPDTLPAASEPGTVIQSRPGPGVGRPAGTLIELVISSGPAELSVPSVVGLSVAEARARLDEIGLSVGQTSTRPVAGRPGGIVVEQRPPAGTRSPRGAKVDLVLSRAGS
jgi:serine/threonine-protein kinase